MLKKLMLLLCLGAFIAVAAVGGCKKPAEDEKPKENGDKPVETDDDA
jgi:hypothetical protein